jgi:hypothetical protein
MSGCGLPLAAICAQAEDASGSGSFQGFAMDCPMAKVERFLPRELRPLPDFEDLKIDRRSWARNHKPNRSWFESRPTSQVLRGFDTDLDAEEY